MNIPLQFAVVGVGGIGIGHVLAVLDAPEATLAAMCDPLGDAIIPELIKYGLDPERIRDVPIYKDYSVMLEKTALDVVIISSPDATHCPYSVQAMEKGVHVMCEKPLSITDEESARMIKTAEKTGMHLFAGQICRFAPSFAAAKEMIDQGAIGFVYCVESQYTHGCHANLPEDNWRKNPPRHATACGGCHAIDLVRYLMGDPDEVFAYGNRFCRTDWVVEDCSETLMHFPDGRIAKVLTTLGCVAEYSMRTVIYGTDGTITANNTSGIVQLFHKDTKTTQEIQVDVATHDCLGEVCAICDELLHGISARHKGMEGAKSLLVCNAAIRSMESGKPERPNYALL